MTARRCLLSKVKSVRNYIKGVKLRYKHSDLLHRLIEAIRMFEQKPEDDQL